MIEPIQKIIHLDMDAFFAAIEQRDNPALQGKPVIVGGLPGKRGVVASASYEARVYGVHSAMPSSKAYQLCPQAIYTKSRYEVYRNVSLQIREIFSDYTDLIEPLSIDEAYLDVTENKKGCTSATLLAQELCKEIYQKTNLTASAGVAPNKFLAKIASDINKPNGIYVIPPKRMKAFIEELPIGKFYGVGKATQRKMHRLKIYYGRDLKNFSKIELAHHFGKAGNHYYNIVRGLDSRKVTPNRTRKSVGVERTFFEDKDSLAIDSVLEKLSEELEQRLQRADVSGKTITLKLRYPDFETITRSETQKKYLQTAESISFVARRLLAQNLNKAKKIRLLGLTISNLDNAKEEITQLLLPFREDFLL